MRPVMDIHSHTFYSACGRDPHEAVIEAAIAGGVELFGICDHNYGVGPHLAAYRADIRRMQEKYAGHLRLLLGLELSGRPGQVFAAPEQLAGFDYVLQEHIDEDWSEVQLDVLEKRSAYPCRFGIAHTDLIGWAKKRGEDPAAFLRRFADADIFWEMNVSYDSIHNYREHEDVRRFLADPAEQDAVRRSGIRLSVGFDGHRVEDYAPERVLRMNRFLEENGFPVVEF